MSGVPQSVCVGSGRSGSGPANHISPPPGTVFTLCMCVMMRVYLSVCVCLSLTHTHTHTHTHSSALMSDVCFGVCTLGHSHCDAHANVSPQQIEKPD